MHQLNKNITDNKEEKIYRNQPVLAAKTCWKTIRIVIRNYAVNQIKENSVSLRR